jgi:hypothetical protein
MLYRRTGIGHHASKYRGATGRTQTPVHHTTALVGHPGKPSLGFCKCPSRPKLGYDFFLVVVAAIVFFSVLASSGAVAAGVETFWVSSASIVGILIGCCFSLRFHF